MMPAQSFYVAVCLVLSLPALLAQTQQKIFESDTAPRSSHPIDKVVFSRLNALHIQPVLCSDAVFVRRAFLDVTGTLPTAQEAAEFINDPDTQTKRTRLIERLLQREEYADYWAMRWGDVLRIKAEFPVNLWPNAAQAYHHWVRASIASNKPYDTFARELLTSSGSNFRVGPVNFYRAVQNRTPEGIAAAVALTFMGCRTDAWTSNQLASLSVFFSQLGYKPTSEWKEEHVFWDPLGSSTNAANIAPGRPDVAAVGHPTNSTPGLTSFARNPAKTGPAMFPDGSKARLRADEDPRNTFADWLIKPNNPWFTRAIVNRVWAWLLGRGVIHEPDDIRPDNPPSSKALLACLQKEFVKSGYDLKHLFQFILTSQTYQLSSLPHTDSMAAKTNFANYSVRRLDAEVLIDAINKITGSSDLYTSPIPEPFTYIPEGQGAVGLGDGSVTSPFLALFGRSARATGMDNERNNRPVPPQYLYLLNSTQIQRKLEQGPALKKLLDLKQSPEKTAGQLYLTILSRYPSEEELMAIQAYGPKPPASKTGKPATSPPKRREDWLDVAWALINSSEFLYRH